MFTSFFALYLVPLSLTWQFMLFSRLHLVIYIKFTYILDKLLKQKRFKNIFNVSVS